MKSALRAFLGYSLVERTALAILGLLLLILLFVRATLAWWIPPPLPDARHAALLNAEYRAWLASQGAEAVSGPTQRSPESFHFDPNTLDSMGFIRLGMPPRAVKGLLNWRRKGKRFRRASDLEPLYNLPPACYARLAPLVRIEEAVAMAEWRRGWFRESPPAVIELNTADSATLDRWVPGIGAVLAQKIVSRRKALGGFRNIDQLLEVYRFPDTTMAKLRSRLSLHPDRCTLLDLNDAGEARLAEHPYIGEKLARNIILYRDALGGYKEITQLRQVPLMTAEIYRKIAPYFTPPPAR